MNTFEAYTYLFFDNIRGALFLPPHQPFIFEVMLEFNIYNKILMIMFATLGAIIGVAFDWLLGRILRKLQITTSFIEYSKYYDKINNIVIRYWLIILILSGLLNKVSLIYIPLEGFVVFSFGLYKIKLGKILLNYILIFISSSWMKFIINF